MTLEKGTILYDRYEIKTIVGQGSFSIMYLALDRELENDVAIKEFNPQSAARFGDPRAMLKRFEQEARITRQLRHPHIIEIFDLFSANDTAYIVMPYLPDTLEDQLEHLNISQAVQVMIQICEGLSYAHAFQRDRNDASIVVHCDIKPDNILFQANQVKITDFGIAHVPTGNATSDSLTTALFVTGTAFYMPPEQLEGTRDNPRVDVYALGSLFYRMLAQGRYYLNFDTSSTTEANLENRLRIFKQTPQVEHLKNLKVPQALIAIILKALSKDPNKRYANAGEMLQAIKSAKNSPQNEKVFVDTEYLEPGTIPGPDLQIHKASRLSIVQTKVKNTLESAISALRKLCTSAWRERAAWIWFLLALIGVLWLGYQTQNSLRVNSTTYHTFAYGQRTSNLSGTDCIGRINTEIDSNSSTNSQQLAGLIVCNTDTNVHHLHPGALLYDLLAPAKWSYKWLLWAFVLLNIFTGLSAPWRFVWNGRRQRVWFTNFFVGWMACVSLTLVVTFSLVDVWDFDFELWQGRGSTVINILLFSPVVATIVASLLPWIAKGWQEKRLPNGFFGKYDIKLKGAQINAPQALLVTKDSNFKRHAIHVLDKEKVGIFKLKSFHLEDKFADTCDLHESTELPKYQRYELAYGPTHSHITLVAEEPAQQGENWHFVIVTINLDNRQAKPIINTFEGIGGDFKIWKIYGHLDEPALYILCKQTNDLCIVEFKWDEVEEKWDESHSFIVDPADLGISQSNAQSRSIAFVVRRDKKAIIRTPRHIVELQLELTGGGRNISPELIVISQDEPRYAYNSLRTNSGVESESRTICICARDDKGHAKFHVYDDNEKHVQKKPRQIIYHAHEEEIRDYVFATSKSLRRVFLIGASRVLVMPIPRSRHDLLGYIGMKIRK